MKKIELQDESIVNELSHLVVKFLDDDSKINVLRLPVDVENVITYGIRAAIIHEVKNEKSKSA